MSKPERLRGQFALFAQGERVILALLLAFALCLPQAARASVDRSALLDVPPDSIYKVIELRADSATGIAPYPAASLQSPWMDLTGQHNAYPRDFHGSATSGWEGEGTVVSPYRLEFTADEERVEIPPDSIPELQTLDPLTVEMWFRTNFDGPVIRADYLCEWLQPGDGGMSIAILDDVLKVYDGTGWRGDSSMEPHTWYHVAVTKNYAQMRIYLNGQRIYTGGHSNMGIQTTPLVLGTSCYRIIEGSGRFGDYLHGAIAQFRLWHGTLNDSTVLASFQADSALYLPTPPLPDPTKVLQLDAMLADGSAPYPSSGDSIPVSSPWVDLTTPSANATLRGFVAGDSSGWMPPATPAYSDYLWFDGLDDVAAIAPGGVVELHDLTAVTLRFWFLTDTIPPPPGHHYLTEWLQAIRSSSGMSIALDGDALQINLGNPSWRTIGHVAPGQWYQVTVVKSPGEVRCYLNGLLRYTANTPFLGDQTTELVLGASTWRGAGQYGDYFRGGIARYDVWQGALSDSAVKSEFIGEVAVFLSNLLGVGPLERSGPRPALAGFRTNPTHGDLSVRFTLPREAPATLEMLDVTGRIVRSREVGLLGAGSHTVDLSSGVRVPVGVYFLRLRQQGRTASSRGVVL